MKKGNKDLFYLYTLDRYKYHSKGNLKELVQFQKQADLKGTPGI